MPAREYQLRVVNGDGGVSPTPGDFALFDPAETCFYDCFESGSGQAGVAPAKLVDKLLT